LFVDCFHLLKEAWAGVPELQAKVCASNSHATNAFLDAPESYLTAERQNLPDRYVVATDFGMRGDFVASTLRTGPWLWRVRYYTSSGLDRWTTIEAYIARLSSYVGSATEIGTVSCVDETGTRQGGRGTEGRVFSQVFVTLRIVRGL
jgi:hypothetical protein